MRTSLFLRLALPLCVAVAGIFTVIFLLPSSEPKDIASSEVSPHAGESPAPHESDERKLIPLAELPRAQDSPSAAFHLAACDVTIENDLGCPVELDKVCLLDITLESNWIADRRSGARRWQESSSETMGEYLAAFNRNYDLPLPQRFAEPRPRQMRGDVLAWDQPQRRLLHAMPEPREEWNEGPVRLETLTAVVDVALSIDLYAISYSYRLPMSVDSSMRMYSSDVRFKLSELIAMGGTLVTADLRGQNGEPIRNAAFDLALKGPNGSDYHASLASRIEGSADSERSDAFLETPAGTPLQLGRSASWNGGEVLIEKLSAEIPQEVDSRIWMHQRFSHTPLPSFAQPASRLRAWSELGFTCVIPRDGTPRTYSVGAPWQLNSDSTMLLIQNKPARLNSKRISLGRAELEFGGFITLTPNLRFLSEAGRAEFASAQSASQGEFFSGTIPSLEVAGNTFFAGRLQVGQPFTFYAQEGYPYIRLPEVSPPEDFARTDFAFAGSATYGATSPDQSCEIEMDMTAYFATDIKVAGLSDESEKAYLMVERADEVSSDSELLAALIAGESAARSFSGGTTGLSFAGLASEAEARGGSSLGNADQVGSLGANVDIASQLTGGIGAGTPIVMTLFAAGRKPMRHAVIAGADRELTFTLDEYWPAWDEHNLSAAVIGEEFAFEVRSNAYNQWSSGRRWRPYLFEGTTDRRVTWFAYNLNADSEGLEPLRVDISPFEKGSFTLPAGNYAVVLEMGAKLRDPSTARAFRVSVAEGEERTIDLPDARVDEAEDYQSFSHAVRSSLLAEVDVPDAIKQRLGEYAAITTQVYCMPAEDFEAILPRSCEWWQFTGALRCACTLQGDALRVFAPACMVDHPEREYVLCIAFHLFDRSLGEVTHSLYACHVRLSFSQQRRAVSPTYAQGTGSMLAELPPLAVVR